jgi:hypothetical protein
MTMRDPKGQSLSAIANQARQRADWIQKLDRNLRSTLNRLGNVASLGPSTFRQPGQNLVLYYDGSKESFDRINDVLGTELTERRPMPVKISRMTVNVVLLKRRQAA